MTSKKLQRTYVQRVVMGPENMFPTSILEDEDVKGKTKLLPWGVFYQRGTDLDVPSFLQRLGLQEQDVVVGKLSESLPTNLTSAEPWTLPDLLTLDRQVEVPMLQEVDIFIVCILPHI